MKLVLHVLVQPTVNVPVARDCWLLSPMEFVQIVPVISIWMWHVFHVQSNARLAVSPMELYDAQVVKILMGSTITLCRGVAKQLKVNTKHWWDQPAHSTSQLGLRVQFWSIQLHHAGLMTFWVVFRSEGPIVSSPTPSTTCLCIPCFMLSSILCLLIKIPMISTSTVWKLMGFPNSSDSTYQLRAPISAEVHRFST